MFMSFSHFTFAQYWNSIANTTDIDNINAGNVGIGTPPTEKLTIQGNLKFGGMGTSVYNFYLKTLEGSSAVNNGNGRNFIISAGQSDNQAGKRGGNLHLRPGTTNGSGTLYGNIYLADEGGNVGIGTGLPDAKLAVKGTIHAEEVKVDLTVPAPDYVFEKNYNLPTLAEVEDYINQNKHLPEVPAAKEMEKNGVNLGEMNMLLLKKVEELTLYMIELKKEIEMLKSDKQETKK